MRKSIGLKTNAFNICYTQLVYYNSITIKLPLPNIHDNINTKKHWRLSGEVYKRSNLRPKLKLLMLIQSTINSENIFYIWT